MVSLVGIKGAAFILLLILGLVFVNFQKVNVGKANPVPYPPLIGMPIEYINATISLVNGTLWAKVDGTYPLYKMYNGSMDVIILKSGYYAIIHDDSLSTKYPIPPDSANISIKVNGKELNWSWVQEDNIYQTAFGDFQYISWVVEPVPKYFVLETHYEHPITVGDEKCTFLYPLITSPFLLPENSESYAYFNIKFNIECVDLQVYTIGTNRTWKWDAWTASYPIVNGYEYDALGNKTWIWNPINYQLTTESTSDKLSLEVLSETDKQDPGDLAITFKVSPSSSPLIELPYASGNYFPEPSSTEIPLDTNISITFGRPPSIVNMSISPEVPIENRTFESIFVSGGRYTFHLAKLLEPSTTYSVTVLFGQQSAPEGIAPTSTRTWNFTTVAEATEPGSYSLVEGFLIAEVTLVASVIVIAVIILYYAQRKLKTEGD